MAEYEAVIGLEVHAQLNTASKLFCSCSTRFGAEANTQVCPVCLGQPGVLPVLNREAFEKAIKAALALGCTVAAQTKFDRKNYYYPDLPKNYQISQYDMPLSEKGSITFDVDGAEKTVRITRLHMEEDAGKLLHQDPRGSSSSLVDLNRTGTPLIEIVTEPDISSPEEAVAYLAALKRLLKYLDVSDCEMQEGSLRCEPNVSVRPRGAKQLGTKTEIKNLNSFRHVAGALGYEIRRQIKLVRKGGRVRQETMLWDVENQRTEAMRSKEEAQDYRYFPEPDLPPFTVAEADVERIRATLPELPRARRERFERELGLKPRVAEVLTAEKPVADYYERASRDCIARGIDPDVAYAETAKWIGNDYLREAQERNLDFADFPVPTGTTAEVVSLVLDGTVTGSIARQKLIPEIFATGNTAAAQIVEAKGWRQERDAGAIATAVAAAVEKNPKALEDYRKGKKTAITFLIGQVMKETRGKANARVVRELLEKKLAELSGS